MNLGLTWEDFEARTWSYQKACSLSSLKVFGWKALEDLEGCLHAYSWLPHNMAASWFNPWWLRAPNVTISMEWPFVKACHFHCTIRSPAELQGEKNRLKLVSSVRTMYRQSHGKEMSLGHLGGKKSALPCRLHLIVPWSFAHHIVTSHISRSLFTFPGKIVFSYPSEEINSSSHKLPPSSCFTLPCFMHT